MDIDESAIGVYPNVAIDPATGERYGKAAETQGERRTSPDCPTDGKTPTAGDCGAQEGLESLFGIWKGSPKDGCGAEEGLADFPGNPWTQSDAIGQKASETARFAENPQESPELMQKDNENDTREKLEADMREILRNFARSSRQCCTASFTWDAAMFTNLLDRQEAITERNCRAEYEDMRDYLQGRIDALEHDVEMWRDRSEDMRMERDGAERKLEQAEVARMWQRAEIERQRGVIRAQADSFAKLEAECGAERKRGASAEQKLNALVNRVKEQHVALMWHQERCDWTVWLPIPDTGAAERKLAALVGALDDMEMRHIWHPDVEMWELYPAFEGKGHDTDAIEDALVRFGWEFPEADTKLAEHRLVRAYAREIAEEMG